MGAYKLNRTGDDVAELLTRMADRVPFLYNTTTYWNSQRGYIPKAGEIIIYSDYQTIDDCGKIINVPGIKIGSGNAYVQDLAFLDSYDAQTMINHIADLSIHITGAERKFWNNKLNVDDNHEVVGEELIFNRN